MVLIKVITICYSEKMLFTLTTPKTLERNFV